MCHGSLIKLRLSCRFVSGFTSILFGILLSGFPELLQVISEDICPRQLSKAAKRSIARSLSEVFLCQIGQSE